MADEKKDEKKEAAKAKAADVVSRSVVRRKYNPTTGVAAINGGSFTPDKVQRQDERDGHAIVQTSSEALKISAGGVSRSPVIRGGKVVA